MDQKFHVKNLIDENMCKNLIQFYEDKIDMASPEVSYKFEQDKIMLDNFGCLNLSQFKDNMGFQGPYDIIINYIRKVVADYEQYVKNTLCPSFRNVFFTNTRNIRILKYDVGQCIKDHSDIDGYTRGSLTINLNDDY